MVGAGLGAGGKQEEDWESDSGYAALRCLSKLSVATGSVGLWLMGEV